jgi:hypothetical protein
MDIQAVFEEMHRPPEPTMGFEIHPDPNPTMDRNSGALSQSTQTTLSRQAERMKEMEARLREAQDRDECIIPQIEPVIADKPIESKEPVAVVFQATQRSLSKAEKALAEMKAALEAKMQA